MGSVICMPRKRRKKHWRKYLSNNLLPARFQLLKYKPLIEKIVSIARGEISNPKDIYQRFNSSLSTKIDLYKLGYSIKEFNHLSSLQEDDLQQQAFLYLMELWDFYTFTWRKQGSGKSRVFYDFARVNLSRWMGLYVGNEIRNKLSEDKIIITEESYELEDPSILKLDLGWVILKNKEGIFGNLTIKQKYLLFLRYTKDMSILSIAELIQQHRATVEKEFSIINTILEGDPNGNSRSESEDSK